MKKVFTSRAEMILEDIKARMLHYTIPKSNFLLLVLTLFITVNCFAQEEENSFATPDINALPQGGFNLFYNYLSKNLTYPPAAKSEGIQGEVRVQFTVEPSGKLSNIIIVKDIGGGCGEEVLRLIKNYVEWIPAIKDDLPIRSRIILPINFTLNDPNSSKIITLPPTPPDNFIGLQEWFNLNRNDHEVPVPINNFNSTVEVLFTIDTVGNATKIYFTRSLGKYFDNEIIKALESMPKWDPASQNGIPVEYQMKRRVSVTKISPQNANSALDKFYQANIAFDNRKFEKALKLYNATIEKDPEPMSFHYNKALTLLRLSRLQDGCGILSEIKEMDNIVKKTYDTFCY